MFCPFNLGKHCIRPNCLHDHLRFNASHGRTVKETLKFMTFDQEVGFARVFIDILILFFHPFSRSNFSRNTGFVEKRRTSYRECLCLSVSKTIIWEQNICISKVFFRFSHQIKHGFWENRSPCLDSSPLGRVTPSPQ